jgi:hypothetical protein
MHLTSKFKLDRETWHKMVQELHKKKFLNGNYNIVMIPITDAVHKKMIYLGDMFLAFDYDTLIYSAFGIEGIGQKDEKKRTNLDKIKNLSQNEE